MADDNLGWIVAAGLGSILLYKWLSAPAVATVAPLPAAPGDTTSSDVPADVPASDSLDQIYQRFTASVRVNRDPAITLYQGIYSATPWVFSYYLKNAGGVDVSSAIETLFPGGADQKPLPLAQFWTAAAGWLAQSKGLKGLGVYGTLFRMAPPSSAAPRVAAGGP